VDTARLGTEVGPPHRVKDRDDPDNVVHLNDNIPPSNTTVS
jgi:hypothetical protein